MKKIVSTFSVLCVFCAVTGLGLGGLGSPTAHAQTNEAISLNDLTRPWDNLSAVVRSIPHSAQSDGGQTQPTQLDQRLGDLETELAPLQAELERIAIQIAANPGFVYDAPRTSAELAEQVERIGDRFDRLAEGLGTRESSEMREGQTALSSLRERLADKNRLEHDLILAVGSGSKVLIQALAGRWWSGAQSVERLRETIAEVRRQLTAAQPDRRD